MPFFCWMLMTAFVTVSATSTERNAPTRLRIAESTTAAFGLRAPVAMDVAIALAVSWKPLVKSKSSATAMTRIRIRRAAVTPQSLRIGRGSRQCLGG